MKAINFLVVLIFSFLLTACNTQTKEPDQTIDQSISKIEVMDFHSTHRCMTCKAIEANTKYTLDTYFANELKDNKVTFQVINVDDKGNATIAEKFEAAGTALILNVITNGQEQHIDLTEFAFMNGTDQEAFSEGLKAKINTALNTL
ncbi:nitrophenyl compound nitroreductase subunit ArsF family protein [Formosa algae]|uniref:Thioredoxin domain-containing protein n=1 Tax=Formosa algae TaxID=225843 RepID=A0A9X0YLC9_9FLAO|nr:nitrophenyl compound nitroreductase subunit ArsF family protein [Formosa algae]MBP1840685.1 hypothetical protein [Formosa algae]MDQ0335902.1 hypothetical protein [Formosa algae]OEI81198.1 hypothetical protein AST99_05945 [Formosa algae]PNW29034.1 hypothetical protein BKP44_05435 [Formosa algae]